MKNTRKMTFLRAIALILSVMMIASAFTLLVTMFASAQESGNTLSYPISDYTNGNPCYEPIPMAVIMINFDADGDGVDDNPDGNGSYNVKNKDKPEYGEQWVHTTEQDWVDILFNMEGASLNNYYDYMSDGKFQWVPVKETYGTQDNGVISIAIKNVHPNCIAGSGQWVHCFNQIVEAASEYMDFSIYDKNGNGIVEKYELCLCFILGGAETSSGNTNMKEVYGFHAYYKDYDQDNELTVDGVKVGRSGFFGTGAISGGKPLTFGVFAHELGHYLGAPDLYDTKNGNTPGYDYAVRSYCVMANGTHGTSPAHFNPYLLSEFGFRQTTEVNSDGEYTLYSKASKEGEYNILKLTTPNPGEYYLIENRYAPMTDTDNFDRSAASHQGLLIWHIDENIHSKTGMTCNDEEDGYDPAVIIYKPRMDLSAAPISVLEDAMAFSNHSTYKDYAVFQPTAYHFPISKTWYSSLTEAEAKLVEDLKVEIISGNGTEMKVRITGSYDLKQTPEFVMNVYEKDQTYFTVTGYLATLNYSVMNNATLEVVDKAKNQTVISQQLKLNDDYTFSVKCEGLTPDTEYEYRIVADTSHGEGVTAKSVYTKPVPVEKTKAKITLVINSDLYKTTSVSVKKGESLKISFPMTKKGYTFEGWYLDEALTQKYEIAPLESVDDFTLYAKWVDDVKETTPPPKQTTGTTAEPTTPPPAEPPADNNGAGLVIVIAVVAVVVIGGAVAAVIIVKKKK